MRNLNCWIGAILLSAFLGHAAEKKPSNWWKGNLHAHTFWSDGDDYPDMVVDWYKSRDYNFLMLSDHNTLQVSNRWVTVVETNRNSKLAFDKYQKRFGSPYIEMRDDKGKQQVRLRRLDEMQKYFNSAERFLLMAGEEVTDRYKQVPIHINVTNVRDLLKPQGGSNIVEVMQNNVNAVFAQRKKTGQPMFPHINHPNFGWAITAEELAQVKGEQFFELYNGHSSANSGGATNRASTERMWDIILTKRVAELKLSPLYGLATDDGHNYHTNAFKANNPGRGWVMVRAAKLTAPLLIKALEAGDFYSSTGIRLKEITKDTKGISLAIDAEAGVEYTTQFIGTRIGYDATNEPIRNAAGEPLRTTHNYSTDIGTLFAEVKGTNAAFTFKGDELYVRARVTSTKLQENPYAKGELEKAWIQPVILGTRARK